VRGYHPRMATSLGSWLVASATALVILGASIAPFLAPAYIRLEQDRVGVPALTGYVPHELDAIAASLVGDLLLWRGDFDVAVGGVPVLDDRERAHMRDVRGVFAGFFLLGVISAVGLVVAARRTTGTEARAAMWRAVSGGARGLAISLAVVGAFMLLAFEAAFEVFHRLFFSSGSYTFDPATDRLVQLFPQAFWSETATVVGIVAIAVALLTMWRARRQTAVVTRSPMFAPSKARP
jgi:integral membrane protein (TIGR01906 family)